VRWAPRGGSEKGGSVAVSSGKGQPNRRLKPTAPGLGSHCVCALASRGVSLTLADADGASAPQLSREPLGGALET